MENTKPKKYSEVFGKQKAFSEEFKMENIDTPMENKNGPKFRHWVMLDNVKEAGQYYVLDIWTWGKHFPAKVDKTVIQTDIPSLLVI